MSNEQAVSDLLDYLGIGGLGSAPHLGPVREVVNPLAARAFGPAAVAELKRLLRTDPAKLMASPPAVLGESPTLAEAGRLLDRADVALQHAEGTQVRLRAERRADPYELPPEYRFEGYDSNEIPIFPNERIFESFDDGWALTATAAWWFRLTHEKPDFPRHSSARPFVYPLMTTNGESTVALFGDWGTGYYHSRYIAKHIGRLRPGQAVHLGDVYYIGGAEEFEARFTPFLERYITPSIPFFSLNANHEMDTHGVAYFAYLERKRRNGGTGGTVAQPQEGSYFCLASDHYQVIGIDTAFFGNGRYRDPALLSWLEARTMEGKSAGKINILLSQNEPFHTQSTKLLRDLQTLADRRMFDLWFWGNQHYCALYAPTTGTPFGGGCVGHAGCPYELLDPADFNTHLVRPLFGETEPRFPRELDVRPGLGNHGFAMLRLMRRGVEIKYIDWRNRERFRLELVAADGQLRWPTS